MPKGSCNCGQWTYEYEGEPVGSSICHCIPCQKTAGFNGSYNLVVPKDKFKKLSGTDKPFNRPGDSGKNVTMTFCSNCCVYMTAEAEAMEGMIVVKGGTVDDKTVVQAAKPQVEIYTKNRPGWCSAFSIEQKEST